MPTVNLETAIADFLRFGQRLQAAQPLTVKRILDEVTAWYRDNRVEGSTLDEDQDILLLQWGATRPFNVSEPTDLRKLGDGEVEFLEQELKYVDITRQVFAPGQDEDADYDDGAVGMSVTLGFAPADGSEPGANMWINAPDEIDAGKKEFLAVPFVQSLLEAPARVIAITISHCG